MSSVPMKMRRIRVRSLLAGCISCLRCVWTSGLTCRSSPPGVFFVFFLLRFPPHSSPFPFSSRVLSFCQRCNSISPLGFCFKKLKNKRGKKKKKKRILLRCDPLSVTQRQRALLHHGLVSEHYSVHIGEPYLRCLSPSVCLRGRTLFFYFSLRRTEPNIEADGDTPSL